MKLLYTCLLAFVLILPTTSVYATDDEDEKTFRLQKRQKLLGTFSGEIGAKLSVHFILFKDKNKDDFRMKPFFIDENKNITELDEIAFTEEPQIVSYHYQENSKQLSVLVKQDKKDQVLEIVDINTETNSSKRKEINYENEFLVVRLADKSILVNREDDETALQIMTVNDSDTQTQIDYSFSGTNEKDFKSIFDTKPETVNTGEFVKNGSVNDSKLYYQDGELIFDVKSDELYKTLQLNPKKKETPKFQDFPVSGYDKVKDINTYIYDKKAFLFINDKEDIGFETYDIESGKQVMSNSLRKALGNKLDAETLDDFIKDSSRNRNLLTGTVNETQENDLVITLDVVDRQYQYDYNWWFHHWFMHEQMMWMHQQMINQPMMMNNFGPHPYAEVPFYKQEEDRSISLVFDAQLQLKSTAVEKIKTKHPKIDRDFYIKPFEDNNKVKDFSISFTDDSVRYLYYSKETDAFHIKTDHLKE